MLEEAPSNVGRIVEHLFREEAGKIIAALTGIFGLHNLELVEDAVQEALLKALRQLSYGNLPPNPAAWLTQVAKNQALDFLRRHTRFREKEEAIIAAIEQHPAFSSQPASAFMVDEIRDDQLRLIFACCHPALPSEAQVALTLKALCGFGVSEIARAFLITAETIAKRLARARARLRKSEVPLEIPVGPELTPRLASVLNVLYLLFNEGYNASQGSDLIRRDLCDEAIRLATLLQDNAATDTPKTPARLDAAGGILLLEEQDRSRWNKEMIADGLSQLDHAASGDAASSFHLQAGIAACHCLARKYEETDWDRILFLYDLLQKINDTPGIALNRAVALAKVRGPAAGLEALGEIENHKALRSYYLFYAIRAEFLGVLDRREEAEQDYRRALSLTELAAERNFLLHRLERL